MRRRNLAPPQCDYMIHESASNDLATRGNPRSFCSTPTKGLRQGFRLAPHGRPLSFTDCARAHGYQHKPKLLSPTSLAFPLSDDTMSLYIAQRLALLPLEAIHPCLTIANPWVTGSADLPLTHQAAQVTVFPPIMLLPVQLTKRRRRGCQQHTIHRPT